MFKYFRGDSVCAKISSPYEWKKAKNAPALAHAAYLKCHSAHADHILNEGLEVGL
jgi:hypothetical protein